MSETSVEGWTLLRLKDGGVRTGAKDNGYRTEDVITVVPRSATSPGIGMGLEEFASDGTVGIVLVDFLVESGNAAKATEPLLPGDALISVQAGPKLTSLEGLTYDATLETLGGLDPAAGALTFTVRRLIRVPRVAVTLTFPDRPDEKVSLIPGQPLRSTFLSNGIKLNDPLALRFDAGYGTGDCGGEGCCCTCALEVVSGGATLNDQKTQERQMLQKHPNWRLACRARIDENLDADSELVLRASPRAWETDVVEECLAVEV